MSMQVLNAVIEEAIQEKQKALEAMNAQVLNTETRKSAFYRYAVICDVIDNLSRFAAIPFSSDEKRVEWVYIKIDTYTIPVNKALYSAEQIDEYYAHCAFCTVIVKYLKSFVFQSGL